MNNVRVSNELLIEVYTATLPAADRKRVLDEFCKEKSVIRCLVCTMAFGMGVDIPDIRYVVLWGAPSTISDTWQQIGRAGRDGFPTEAHLFFTPTSLASKRVEHCVRGLAIAANELNCLRLFILKHVSHRPIQLEPLDAGKCCINVNEGHDFHSQSK